MDPTTWELSILIALLSFLASLLAALYARWVWGEARKTNILALHNHRLEVYRAFQNLRQSLQTQGLGVTEKVVAQFYQASRESKFYFSDENTSELVAKYFDISFQIATEKRKLDRENLDQSTIEDIHTRQDELSKLEQSLFKNTERQLEKELLQAVRRGWLDA